MNLDWILGVALLRFQFKKENICSRKKFSSSYIRPNVIYEWSLSQRMVRRVLIKVDLKKEEQIRILTSSTYIQTRQQNHFKCRTHRHIFRAWEALKKWATEAIQSPVEIMMDKDEVHLGKKICKLSLTNYIINFCHWSIGKQTTRVRIHHDQNSNFC